MTFYRSTRLEFALLVILACANGCSAPAQLPAHPLNNDVQFSQSSSGGMIAFDHGDVKTAALLYARALKRAHAMDDARSVADSAYNLAACEIALGRLDSASTHLDEANYNGLAIGMNVDEVGLLTAKVAFLRRMDGDADQIAQPLTHSGSPAVRIQAQTLLTLISCDKANVPEAKSRLASLTDMVGVEKKTSDSIAADIECAQGKVAQLDHKPVDAATHFDRETVLLRTASRYPDMAHSLSRAGSVYEQAGRWSVAADRYYRAAQGYDAFDDRENARRFAAKALSAAKAANDATLTRVVEQLVSVLSPTVSP